MSLLVGLTGGMGSGKSLAAEIFRRKSAKIINADVIAKDLVLPGKLAWKEIVASFGQNILSVTGEIDRYILSEIIFNDSEKRKILESILHPKIFKEELRIYEQITYNDPNALVILEAALLIETENYKNVDRLIVISCRDEERTRRLIKRENLSIDAIEKRLDTQMKLNDKIKYADFLLTNDGTKADLEKQVEDLYFILTEQV